MVIHGLRHFFIVYGYFVAAPVMIVEGPIATMLMAALASRGYFNITTVFLIGLGADFVSDYAFYKIGFHGAAKIISRLSKTFNFDIERVEIFKNKFQNHGTKAIFMAKILPGLVPPVFIAAGLAKYPLKKMYTYAVPAGVLWTAALCFIGFYFGKHLRSVQSLLSGTGIILAAIVIFFILYQYVFRGAITNRALRSKSFFAPEADKK